MIINSKLDVGQVIYMVYVSNSKYAIMKSKVLSIMVTKNGIQYTTNIGIVSKSNCQYTKGSKIGPVTFDETIVNSNVCPEETLWPVFDNKASVIDYIKSEQA